MKALAQNKLFELEKEATKWCRICSVVLLNKFRLIMNSLSNLKLSHVILNFLAQVDNDGTTYAIL